MTREAGGGRDHGLDELAAVIARLIADTNDAWSTGRVAPTSTLLDVTDDFVAAQHAAWYDGGTWVGDRAAWVEGNAAAAASGPGHRWEATVHDLLPRGDDEAIAVYTVRLHWPDPARRPAVAVFLETWRRVDGRWLLARHTAEKA